MESASAPRYRVPSDIAWIDGTEVGLGEDLYLTRLPGGATVQLKDTARMIWHAAMSSGDPTEQVASLVGRQPAEVAAEVNTFIDDLLGAALLVKLP